MGAHDDFGQWEREFDESDTAPSRRTRLMVTLAVTIGCALLFFIGEAPLAIAGLIVSGLIMALWRAGM
jgi:hypothetical protein